MSGRVAWRSHGGKLERKRRATRAIEEIIRDGIEVGRFKKLPPVVVTEVFVGSLTGMIDSMAGAAEAQLPRRMCCVREPMR